MKEIVMKWDLCNNEEHQEAIGVISSLPGYNSVRVDMKITVKGDVDPVTLAQRLNNRQPKIISWGSVEEEKKSKVVMKLNLPNNQEKRRAMRAISDLSGIDSIAVDMREKTMTIEVMGEVDLIEIASRLGNERLREIVSVGPAIGEKKVGGKGVDPSDLMAILVCFCVVIIILGAIIQ